MSAHKKSAVMARSHTVTQCMEQSTCSGLEDWIYEKNTICINQFLIKSCIVVTTGTYHSFAHYKTTGTSNAACTEIKVPVKRMDEFDLSAGFFCSFKSNAAHGIVITILCSS